MNDATKVKQHWFEYGPFTIFDVETTGFSAVHHRIIEIAAIRIETDGEVSNYQTLVNPGTPVPGAAAAVTGLNEAMLIGAPRFNEIAYDFINFIHGTTLVAHNARFDLGFLQESLARHGLEPWRGKTLDSLKLFKTIYPGLKKYNLPDLCARFNVELPAGTGLHRAATDAAVTMALLEIAFNAIISQQA